MDDRRTRSKPEALEGARRRAWQPRRDDLLRALAAGRAARDRIDELRARLEPPDPSAYPCCAASRVRGRQGLRWIADLLFPHQLPALRALTPEVVEWLNETRDPETPPLVAEPPPRLARAWSQASERTRSISEEIARLEGEHWRFLAEIENRRTAQEAGATLPFGDSALEELAKLRVDFDSFVAARPPPNLYKQRFLRFAKTYNELSTFDRYCEECGLRFALVVGDARSSRGAHCSDGCAARARQRGRPHVSAAEKVERWMERHLPACSVCNAGTLCVAADRKLHEDRALRGKVKGTPK